MADEATVYEGWIEKTIIIDAAAEQVWAALTEPVLMKQWMSDAVTSIVTDWRVGGPLTISGVLAGKQFENTGVVLAYEPGVARRYSHLSSLSELEDKEEQYTILDFRLAPAGSQTQLTLRITNFPTEAIYRHLAFYWNVTLVILKKFIERK